MESLIVKHHSAVVAEIPLTSPRISIGRDPANGVVIPGDSCSPFHAAIQGAEGRRIVADLGSLTGTYINDRRIKRAAICPGDRIAVGDHVLEIRGTISKHGPVISPKTSGPTNRPPEDTAAAAPSPGPESSPARKNTAESTVSRVVLSGILDERSDDYLDRSLSVPLPRGSTVILDFSGVPSVTGDGWRFLIRHIRTLEDAGPIQFTHMNPAVLKGFRALGLGRFFTPTA